MSLKPSVYLLRSYAGMQFCRQHPTMPKSIEHDQMASGFRVAQVVGSKAICILLAPTHTNEPVVSTRYARLLHTIFSNLKYLIKFPTVGHRQGANIHWSRGHRPYRHCSLPFSFSKSGIDDREHTNRERCCWGTSMVSSSPKKIFLS